jgi:hypothetical protein
MKKALCFCMCFFCYQFTTAAHADNLAATAANKIVDRVIYLKSSGLKKNFALKIVMFDGWNEGYVLYEGQSERIPIRFDHAKTIFEVTGRPDFAEHFYNEIHKGKITGVYTLRIQGAPIYSASYTRKKDGKQFELTVEEREDEM